MIPAVAVLSFLADHLDLFTLIHEAIANRAISKERLVEAIKTEMTRASDELVSRELEGK